MELILNESDLIFQQCGVGFHSQVWESQEVKSYEDDYGADHIYFVIKEFTSEEEDYFGTNVSRLGLIARTRYVSFVTEDVTYLGTFLGDFGTVDGAVRFAQFVVEDYAENKFSACPVIEFDHYLIG
jgi:hypothetical protein